LPARGGAGAHWLAADVSAFANGAGGDIVYCIDEDGDAKASAIVPLTVNADEELDRLGVLISDFAISAMDAAVLGELPSGTTSLNNAGVL